MAAHVEDSDEHRDRPAAELLLEAVEVGEVEERLRHREPGAGLDLPAEPVELGLEVVRRGVDGDAEEERRRRVDALAVEVLAVVEPRDDLREADRVDLVDAARARVVTDLGRIARYREDVANALGMRAEEERLEAHDRGVPRRDVRDRLDAAG